MKKILCMLLSLIMILSLIPATVFASEYIRDVYVTNIPVPIAGVKWGSQWDKSEMTYDNSSYAVFQQPEWYDETEKRFLESNEVFKEGHSYTVQVWVEANDGYEFDASATAYNMKGYINGNEAKLSKAFEYQTWAMVVLSYTFPEVKNNKKITNISVTDIVEPKIGKQSIARPHYLKYSEGVEGYRASWYENYHAGAEKFTGVFAEEKTYTFEVIMEAKEGYEFARKGDEADVTVTFNGIATDVVAFDGGGRLCVRFEYENLGVAKEKVMGAITYKIKEPVIGENPSYEAENQRDDNLYVIDTKHSGTVNGIVWEEGISGNSRVMNPEDTFKAGEYYHVTIWVKPAEGYLFDKDRNDDFMLVGAINSEEAICGGTDESAFVGYTFDKLEEEKRTIISEVEAVSNYSDIAYIGDKESTPQFTVTKGTPVRIEFTGWQTKDEKGEFVNLPHGGTFTDAPVKVLGQMVIDGDANKEYVLAKNVKLTVNGIEWLTGHSGFYDEHSACSAVSMEINTLTKKEDEKPAETDKPQETEKPQELEEPTETDKPAQTDTPRETEKSIFVDVSKGQYYYDAVMWAANEGITGGTSANTFSPDSICTRAQVVTFLHRMIASPEPAAIDMPFVDVKTSDYFYKPVKWAFGSKITGGTSNTTFSPDENCTRAQVVTFLWRTAGQPKPNGKSNPFTDVKADSYYYDAVLWAVENGITGGTSANTFSPDSNCTRAQVVTFLWRTAGQQKASGKSNPFADVKADSYYYDAVLWAVENGITGGTSANTFSPGGVKTYNSGEDSPKVIESTEIISFEFEVSLYNIVLEEESELVGRNYKLSAVLEDGAVKSKIKWRDRAGAGEEGDFTADISFMTSLQELVSKYNFAQYNGYISKVSGLPDMYGAKIDIAYASGESIYAHNNQDCFIPFEAIEELIEIFEEAEKE